MELTDTNKPCGLTISFINSVKPCYFSCQDTGDRKQNRMTLTCSIKNCRRQQIVLYPGSCILVPDFSVAIARRSHPFPFRTRKLSSSAPMVLHGRLCGRVGRCRSFFIEQKPLTACGKGFFASTLINFYGNLACICL